MRCKGVRACFHAAHLRTNIPCAHCCPCCGDEEGSGYGYATVAAKRTSVERYEHRITHTPHQPTHCTNQHTLRRGLRERRRWSSLLRRAGERLRDCVCMWVWVCVMLCMHNADQNAPPNLPTPQTLWRLRTSSGERRRRRVSSSSSLRGGGGGNSSVRWWWLCCDHHPSMYPARTMHPLTAPPIPHNTQHTTHTNWSLKIHGSSSVMHSLTQRRGISALAVLGCLGVEKLLWNTTYICGGTCQQIPKLLWAELTRKCTRVDRAVMRSNQCDPNTHHRLSTRRPTLTKRLVFFSKNGVKFI